MAAAYSVLLFYSASRSTNLLKGPYRKAIPHFPLLIRASVLYGPDRRFVLALLAIALVPTTATAVLTPLKGLILMVDSLGLYLGPTQVLF